MKKLTTSQKQVLGLFLVLGLFAAAQQCPWFAGLCSSETEVEGIRARSDKERATTDEERMEMRERRAERRTERRRSSDTTEG